MHNEAENLIDSWLALQSKLIPGSLRAMVMLGEDGHGPYRPVATWPDESAATPGLANAAASALQRRALVMRSKDSAPAATRQQGHIIASPISQDGALLGVVAIETDSHSKVEPKAVAKMLAINSAWLELLLRSQSAQSDMQPLAVMDLIASCIEHTGFEAAARSTITRFGTKLGCERVSLGLIRRDHVDIKAISGIADLTHEMRSTRAIAASMDEAISQDTTILYPNESKETYHATRCHAELSQLSGNGSICTIPIIHDGNPVGAITVEFERENGFTRNTLALCDTAVSLIGPILYEKYLQGRSSGARLHQDIKVRLAALLGPGRLMLKLGTAAALGAAVFLGLVTGEYRVTAEAILEGTVQRMIVSPIPGYIDEVTARAGDIVEAGQLLCRLDDKDLELERIRWSSEKEKLEREYRQAMAQHDSSRVTILRSQLDQAIAQLTLAEDNLSRTRVTSPMAGIIIAGDLTQSLGVPVERGDTLFEVAPLDSYRVMLEVDERDVRELSPGQSGRLALVGLPNQHLQFEVERITPIATISEGRNFFAVEAQLEMHPELLRPGMKGIGKIDIGKRRIIWIWSHRLIEWFRLWTWTWTP
jgi:multidrug resistance efflux pump